MCSSFVYWICVLLLVWDLEIPTHPYDWRQHMLVEESTVHQQLRFAENAHKLKPIFCVRWGFWASVRFLLDSSRLQILSVNSIWTACEFNNRMEISQNSIWTACEFNNRMEISQNAETFNHLALLTMLSALRHGWGMLALCRGEIERYFMKLDSQPTLVLPNIRNKNRATVADDRARCDTPKNLCIVLILPLAALRITYGKRISSDACLYTALKWNSCLQ